VTLTAAETTYSKFIGWSGLCTGTAPTCLVTITDALATRGDAAFDGPRELSLTVSGVNGGLVSELWDRSWAIRHLQQPDDEPQICLGPYRRRRW